MSYAPFTYYTVTWKRPRLTPEEEAAVGAQVARFGKTYYRRHFSRNVSQSYLTPEQQAKLEKFRSLPRWRRALQYSLFAVVMAVIFYSVGFQLLHVAAPILAFIALVYFATYGLALFRYNRWLTHCLARYYHTLRDT